MTKKPSEEQNDLNDAKPTAPDSALIKMLENLAFKIQNLADRLIKMLPGH